MEVLHFNDYWVVPLSYWSMGAHGKYDSVYIRGQWENVAWDDRLKVYYVTDTCLVLDRLVRDSRGWIVRK